MILNWKKKDCISFEYNIQYVVNISYILYSSVIICAGIYGKYIYFFMIV